MLVATCLLATGCSSGDGAAPVVLTCQGTGRVRYSLGVGDDTRDGTVDCPTSGAQEEQVMRAGSTATLTASTDPGKGVGNFQLVAR